jgi:predicted GNAT family acetyltransferase
MLYVEGDNSAARGLYAQLGFVLHHEDVAYG